MTTKELHILIQQGLQNLDIFRYAEVSAAELDIHINHIVFKLVESYFQPEGRALPFLDIQFAVDDLRVLEQTNKLTASGANNLYFINFPANYNHLLEDVSILEYSCYENNKLVKKQKRAENRLTKPQIKERIKNSFFNRTNINSPISYIQGNSLFVLGNDEFIVKEVEITYSKKPQVIEFIPNITTVLEFPDVTCYKIVEAVVIYLAKITEQNPNKIISLQQ